jgi:hypothetical protein
MMKCTHDKDHDKLSFSTLKHLTGMLDDALQQGGIKSANKREAICSTFIFRTAYLLDNQWVEFGKRRYRIGLCFQEFRRDPFAPTSGLIADYSEGEMLHEAAIGITDAHFTKDNSVVRSFDKIGEVYAAHR